MTNQENQPIDPTGDSERPVLVAPAWWRETQAVNHERVEPDTSDDRYIIVLPDLRIGSVLPHLKGVTLRPMRINSTPDELLGGHDHSMSSEELWVLFSALFRKFSLQAGEPQDDQEV